MWITNKAIVYTAVTSANKHSTKRLACIIIIHTSSESVWLARLGTGHMEGGEFLVRDSEAVL